MAKPNPCFNFRDSNHCKNTVTDNFKNHKKENQ